MFSKANENATLATKAIVENGKTDLTFGVSYLDDALTGIAKDDLILLGAPSGAGKTHFCTNLALANLENGKRVHMIALEASRFEIEQRLIYQTMASHFFSDQNRPKLKKPLSFQNWYLNELGPEILPYQEFATEFASKSYSQLQTSYKEPNKDFTVDSLTEAMYFAAEDTDLLIVDHVHYFDWFDENESNALKQIAKTARTLSLEIEKPIILVSHLRKRDRFSKELCPGMEEFHGSSDLFKIATRVISLAPGGVLEPKKATTYFRISKNRYDGSVTRYLGKCQFNYQKVQYEKEYKLGWAGASEFEVLGNDQRPPWASEGSCGTVGHDNFPFQRDTGTEETKKLRKNVSGGPWWNQRD